MSTLQRKARTGMIPQTRSEFGIQFGKLYWKFLEFRANSISKDAYLILHIPDVGLHLSIHSPKPPIFPNWHLHWRSLRLGIDEDIDDALFSPEDWKAWAMERLESFRYYEPLSDENVTVFPLLSDYQKIETMGRRERTAIDVGRLMQTMGNGVFYRTKAKRLPLLMREKHYGNMSICAFSENGMIIPVDSETMIEVDLRKMNMEESMRSKFGSLIDPMDKAFAAIQRISPNSFQRWFPTPYVEDFLNEIINPLKYSKPKIIEF